MSIELKVPVFPESVADGTLLSWNVKPGEAVQRDQSVAEIETDKVVFEVPAPEDGVLEDVLVEAGATVTSGQVIGHMQAGESPSTQVSGSEAVAETATAETAASEPFATPAARKLIEQHGLDASRIPASGSGHRILKEDVLAVLEKPGEEQPAPPGAGSPAAASPSAPPGTPDLAEAGGERPERRVPMSRLRARIAERLVEAQHTAAILTTFNEVNMQAVMDLRARYREAFEKKHGVRLGFMPFFVQACVEALKRFPQLNASLDGHDVVYHGYFDIGIAVSSPRGLVVPILRDADALDMADIESRIRDFATRATDGSLSLEEITGGTFTITNGGVFGSLLSTPILNPPQTGILGMHAIQQRPVAEDGQVVIRPMMNLALSYDHRLVDGREAVQFLVTVKELIEDPARLVLGV